MARGWESKAIETQQEEAAQVKRGGVKAPTVADRQDATRRGTLELAKSRALADLGRATTPAHREMLQRALADLDDQLRNLGSG